MSATPERKRRYDHGDTPTLAAGGITSRPDRRRSDHLGGTSGTRTAAPAVLLRADSYLAAVVQEARLDGEPDAYAEGLRRDIALALSG